MEEESKFKTLINNLTPSQRIGIVLGAVIFFGILILGVLLIPTNNNDDEISNESNSGVSSGGGGSGNSGSSEASGDSSDSSEYVDPESTPIVGGDYNDINTYLPHAVFMEEPDYTAMRYYISTYEDDGVNVILVEYSDCDSMAKTLADEYLKTIPGNLLSDYTVEYETISEDVYCTE